MDSLEGPDEDVSQDDQNPPVMPKIEGHAEKDQEPQAEDDEPIGSCTHSQMEPISMQTHSSSMEQMLCQQCDSMMCAKFWRFHL